MDASDPAEVLDTTGGEFRLRDYRLRSNGREWVVWHTGAVLTDADEAGVIGASTNRLPYGVALWPSAIALAHEVAGRPGDFAGRTVLELGSGLGLPGIVAATLGARVLQTDRDELALHLARRNSTRNGALPIEHRLADWTAWDVAGRFDWVIGSDILYGASLHLHLRAILAAHLAPGGRILLADPFRATGLRFLEALEGEGWRVTYNHWDVGEDSGPRPVGVFDLLPP